LTEKSVLPTIKKFVVCYSRVSSVGQSLDRQTEGFSAAQKFDRTYTDKISGIVPFADRPSGARLLEDCGKGIIGEVHFWELSRLGRDTLDVLSTIQFFVKAGIQVVVAKEGIMLLDSAGKLNPTASIIIAVMSALAGIERTNLRERQLEGIAVAKAQGKYVGRRHGTEESADHFLAKPKSIQIAKMLADDYPVIHVAKILGVSTTTVIKVKRRRALSTANA
jgi:DNA invertase Pin-like site-specific DNA recombinase